MFFQPLQQQYHHISQTDFDVSFEEKLDEKEEKINIQFDELKSELAHTQKQLDAVSEELKKSNKRNDELKEELYNLIRNSRQ